MLLYQTHREKLLKSPTVHAELHQSNHKAPRGTTPTQRRDPTVSQSRSVAQQLSRIHVQKHHSVQIGHNHS